ncbi:MAG TPA: tetratricopeptide repeat protein [Chitinophagaceae bacterium]
MSNSTNDMSQKLLRYLDDELAGTERAELEKQLLADKALQEELEGLKLAREAVHSYGLQQEVAAVHQEMMKEFRTPVIKISSSRRIIRFTMSVAAGLLIIFVGITVYNYYSLTPEKLFRNNYQSYELSTVRDGSAKDMSPVEKAYREKNYADVVAISFDRPFTIKEDLLRAMSYTELADNEKAITSYKEVIAKNEATGTNVLKEEAEYYLALTYIRHKEYNQALDLLTKIHNNSAHLYHGKVTNKLIRKVKKLR